MLEKKIDQEANREGATTDEFDSELARQQMAETDESLTLTFSGPFNGPRTAIKE